MKNQWMNLNYCNKNMINYQSINKIVISLKKNLININRYRLMKIVKESNLIQKGMLLKIKYNNFKEESLILKVNHNNFIQ